MSLFKSLRLHVPAISLALCLSAGVLFAETRLVGVGIRAGTPGLGGELTVRLADSLNLRFGYTELRLDLDPDFGSRNTDDLNVKIDLQNAPLLLDWHPGSVRFRFSGGMVYNRNRMRMRAYSGDTVMFNDVAYGVESAAGTVTFNKYGPYAGIGYGNAVHPDTRWNFAFDLGLMYHGKPRIDYRATATHPEIQATLDRDVEAEIDEIRETTDQIRFFPVVAFGLTFRF